MTYRYTDVFTGTEIIKSYKPLEDTYIPPSLHVRADEAERLIIRYLNKLRRGGSFTDISVIYGRIGRVGIGKTTLAKYVANVVKNESVKYGINFNYVYINVHNPKSLYQIFKMIAERIGIASNISGISPNVILKLIVHFLYKRNMFLLVILDEFHKQWEAYKDRPDDLYTLFRVHEEEPSPDGVNRIAYLLVSYNDGFLSDMKNLAPQLESMISLKVSLNPYTRDELFSILLQRAELALHPGTWDESLLYMIADAFAYDPKNDSGEGNARKAIGVLRTAAEEAESRRLSRITEDIVRRNIAKESSFIIDYKILEEKDIHELLIIKAIADLTTENKNSGVALEFITSQVKSKYNQIAEVYGVKPLGNTQFNQRVSAMKKLRDDIVDIRDSGKGVRGRTTVYRLKPDIPAEELSKAIDKVLRTRLQSL